MSKNRKNIENMSFLEKCDLPIERISEFWGGKKEELDVFLRTSQFRHVYKICDLIEIPEESLKEWGHFRIQNSLIKAIESIGLKFGSRVMIQKARLENSKKEIEKKYEKYRKKSSV